MWRREYYMPILTGKKEQNWGTLIIERERYQKDLQSWKNYKVIPDSPILLLLVFSIFYNQI